MAGQIPIEPGSSGEVPIELFMRRGAHPLQPARASNFRASFKANVVEDLGTKRRLLADSLFPLDPSAVNRVGIVHDQPAYVDESGQLRLSSTGSRIRAVLLADSSEIAGATIGGFSGSPVAGASLGAMGGRGDQASSG